MKQNKINNLVCVFWKESYSRAEFDLMRDMGDYVIYKKAQEGTCYGYADLYTMTDFEIDFNQNLPQVSPENVYIAFICVDENELPQWEK